jgi:hypothetical protein
VLETEGKQWREWFIAAIESGGGSPQTKLARIFQVLKDWFGQERFYGCPFINAVGEHDKDEKQLRAIALRPKKIVLASSRPRWVQPSPRAWPINLRS